MYFYLRAFAKKFPETFVYKFVTGLALDISLMAGSFTRVLFNAPDYIRNHWDESEPRLFWRFMPKGLKKFILDVELEKHRMEREHALSKT